MENSNSKIEIVNAMSRIQQMMTSKGYGNNCSSSTYGIVTHYSNNTIRIVNPLHWSGTNQSQINEMGIVKIICSNIETEFKELKKVRFENQSNSIHHF